MGCASKGWLNLDDLLRIPVAGQLLLAPGAQPMGTPLQDPLGSVAVGTTMPSIADDAVMLATRARSASRCSRPGIWSR